MPESEGRDYYAEKQAEKNEVGELPPVKDPELRRRVTASLEAYMVEFFGAPDSETAERLGAMEIFSDPFGKVQKDSILQEQRALERGSGKINKLEPRGYGKSTRSLIAATWAILTGVQDFVLLCCDSQTKATNLLSTALMALSKNRRLRETFPELICFEKLDQNPHRAQYQTYQGEKTQISIKGSEIKFPRLGPDYVSSGAIIRVCPFLKARGTNIETKRPSIVILDDIQSTEDALNPNTVRKYLATLASDIALLGTRSKPVAIINNATVIQPDDFPSSLAEMKSIATIRYKMVESMPDRTDLWDEYSAIRSDYDPSDPDDIYRARSAALDFYKANRESMDAGSVVTWDYAYSRDPYDYQISTIQAAMDFISDWGMDAFLSECQNEPRSSVEAKDVIGPEWYQQRFGDHLRGELLDWGTKMAFGVDVSDYNLHWVCVAADDRFRSGIIDYGVYVVGNNPDMKRATKEVQLRTALSDFRVDVLEQFPFDLCYIDAGFLAKEVIYPWIAEANDPRIKPCMGSGDRGSPRDFRTFKAKKSKTVRPGYFQAERLVDWGIWLNWLDSDKWKQFVRDRFATQSDDVPGSLRLFVPDQEDLGDHHSFGVHLANEVFDVDKGKWVAKKRNHWSDALYYAMAALGRLGCRVELEKRRRFRRKVQVRGN